MRLNQENVREIVIQVLESLVSNKSHLPWDQVGKDRIHRYLLTIAEINTLGNRVDYYNGMPLDRYNVFAPLGVLLLPERVTQVADDTACNLINYSQYTVDTKQFNVLRTVTQGKESTTQQFDRKPMDVFEFERFGMELIVAMRGNSSRDMVPVTQFRKPCLVTDVCEREIVNGNVKEMATYGMDLNTTTYMPICYGVDWKNSFALKLQADLRRWFENK